jgi:hypothetical protein
MGNLYINFTEPTPAPTEYFVEYKRSIDTTWGGTLIPGPPPFIIPVFYSGQEYDVKVYSSCGDGIVSDPDLVTNVPFDDCQEYSFNNSSGVNQTLTYYVCGDPDNPVTITMPNGDVQGPFCLSNGSGPYTNPEAGLVVTVGSPCLPTI